MRLTQQRHCLCCCQKKMSCDENIKNWLLINEYPDHLELRVDDRHIFCLYVLEPNLCRVLIKREGELALSRTWSIAPQGDVPWSGRDRLSLEGFSPGYQLEKHEQQLVVTTECLRVTIHQPLHLTWEYKNPHGEWLPLAADRPTSAYLLSPQEKRLLTISAVIPMNNITDWAKKPVI